MIKKLYRFVSNKFQTIFLDYPVDFKPRYGHGNPLHPELNKIIGKNADDYARFINEILDQSVKLGEIKKQADESDVNQPCWNNKFLPGLDIAALYTMTVSKRPKKYLEIGSGNSTKVVYKAKNDYQLETEIISIDPLPRAEIDHLANRIIRAPFETISSDIVMELEEGDILFIDNSHRILPNSDSMVFFMEVLPRLKPGVIVQVHDIYLPYDYPQFMCDRAYSEQYGLAFFLLANPNKFEVLLPNYYISQDDNLSKQLSDLWLAPNLKDVEQHGGSFWFKVH